MKLEVGKVYVCAGVGELLVEALPGPPPRVTPHTRYTPCVSTLGHGNLRGSVDPGDFLREATAADIQLRHDNAKARNVACRHEDCWCRKYLERP